jgi:hypothetical protein
LDQWLRSTKTATDGRRFEIHSVGSYLPSASYRSDANKPEADNHQMTGSGTATWVHVTSMK